MKHTCIKFSFVVTNEINKFLLILFKLFVVYLLCISFAFSWLKRTPGNRRLFTIGTRLDRLAIEILD